MARRLPNAKRASKPNPRVDRNRYAADNVLEFVDFEPNTRSTTRNRRDQRRHPEQDQPAFFKPKQLNIVPRNLAQEEYLEALSDENNSIIFAMGPAGTGKTMLATQFAIKGLIEGRYKKIVITRPAVSVDEQHGFLPGTLIEKMAPWVAPIIDVFKECFPVAVVEKMIREEVISIVPLAFMRGRTFKDSFVICDEAQNMLPSQMKMALTRIGENSRMVVTGDLQQHDRGFGDTNGLKDFVERLRLLGATAISVCQFDARDIERHPVIEQVLRVYGEE